MIKHLLLSLSLLSLLACVDPALDDEPRQGRGIGTSPSAEAGECGHVGEECCAVDAGAGECKGPSVCGYDGERWLCLPGTPRRPSR